MNGWLRVVTLGIMAAALSGPATANVLLHFYRLAQQHDADFAAAKAAYHAGQEAVPQARAAVLPTVSANAGYTHHRTGIQQTPFSSGGGSGNFPTAPFSDSYNGYNYGVQITQPLFNWSVSATLRQGHAQADVATLAFGGQKLRLRSAVSSAYLDFLQAQAALELARAQRKANVSDLKRVKGRYQVGEVSVTDLRQAQAAFDGSQSRIIAARTALDRVRENVRRITGAWYEAVPGIKGKLRLQVPQPDNMQKWLDIAFAHNANYLAARQQAKIAEDEISQQRSDYIPNINLVAGYQKTDQSNYILGSASNDLSVGLQATWTLFAGGRNISEVRQARANYDKAQAQLDSTRRQLAANVRNLYRSIKADIRNIQALNKAVDSARVALKSVHAEFEVGERTQTDVLEARRDLFSARNDRVRAIYAYLNDVVGIKAQAGTFGVADLKQLDAHLTGAGSSAIPQILGPK